MSAHRGRKGPLAELRPGPVPTILLALLTVGLVLTWRFVPLSADRLATTYVACVGVVVGWSVTRALARATASQRSEFSVVAAPVHETGPDRPHELVEVERMVAGALRSALEVHLELRPFVRAVAAPSLASVPHDDIDHLWDVLGPGDVGNEVRELVRPDRPRPADRATPGLDLAKLRAIVDELENQPR